MNKSGDRMIHFDSPAALLAGVGTQFGPTEWLTVDQERIDMFAAATGDFQWIHCDPERSREGPFGGTIAHGYLTLALFAAFLPQLFTVDGVAMGINAGLNRVRFLTPVRSGSRLRATAELLSAAEKGEAIEAVLHVVIEVEGAEKPACILEPVIRYSPDRAPERASAP